jgi:hypothetical protein
VGGGGGGGEGDKIIEPRLNNCSYFLVTFIKITIVIFSSMDKIAQWEKRGDHWERQIGNCSPLNYNWNDNSL